MKSHRKTFIAGASVAAALALAACGNDVPPNGVAKIGDTVIKRSDFDHWLGAAARGQQPPGGAAQVSLPDPPAFAKCVAAKKKQPSPEGAPKPTDSQLKQQCEQEYDSLKEQVMQFLVSAEWIEQEASERGIKITDAEVRKQFTDQKKQSFPDDKAYKEFLESSGQTEQDLLFRVRLDVLSNKVRQKIIEGKGKVTEADIKNYYEENKERFAQPERRDLAVVLTRTRSKAEQAREALDSGQTFKQVAKRFSIDEASKSQGGKLPGVAKGQQEKSFDDAIFKAKRGQTVGPVKTQFGWYVFQVTKITAASQQSLEQTKETIRNLLRSEREQKALDDFIEDFRKKYKEETQCAEDFVIQDCDNAPKPKTDTGPASGGAPQPAPPPGAGGQAPPPGAGGQAPQPVPVPQTPPPGQ